MKLITTIFLFVSLLLFIACGEDPNENNSNANSSAGKIQEQKSNVNDDFALLGEKINVPFEPDDVLWQEETLSQGKKLTAVIKFYQEDMGKLMPMLEKVEVNQEVGIEPEEWFPDEVKTQAEQSGDKMLRGIFYKTTPFQKEPYTKGTLIQIPNSEYFILYLSTN